MSDAPDDVGWGVAWMYRIDRIGMRWRRFFEYAAHFRSFLIV